MYTELQSKMHYHRTFNVNITKSEKQSPLWVSKRSSRLSLWCTEVVTEDLCFSLRENRDHAGLDSRRVTSVLTFFTLCWCSRSHLVVCFGPSAMVVEIPQCSFLSCQSGWAIESFVLDMEIYKAVMCVAVYVCVGVCDMDVHALVCRLIIVYLLYNNKSFV